MLINAAFYGDVFLSLSAHVPHVTHNLRVIFFRNSPRKMNKNVSTEAAKKGGDCRPNV